MNGNQYYQTGSTGFINHESGIIQNIRVCKSMLDSGALTPEEYSNRKQISLSSEYINPVSGTKPKKSGLYALVGAMFILATLIDLILTALVVAATDANYSMTPWQIIGYALSFVIAVAYFMKNDKFISVLWFAKMIPQAVYFFDYFDSVFNLQVIAGIVLNAFYIIICALFGASHLQTDKAKIKNLSMILFVVVFLHRFLLMINDLGFFSDSYTNNNFMAVLVVLMSFVLNFLPWLAAVLLVSELSKEKKDVSVPDVFIPLAAAGNLIMEYKALLDMGAITPEEFEAKRVSLLSKSNQM